MTRRKKRPMEQATDDMIAAADSWLTPLDAPAVAQLRILATQLDTEPTAALSSSYGLIYRSLLKRQPAADAGPDGLGALLDDAGV